jgi:8-oxo-dGTP diphosphatase
MQNTDIQKFTIRVYAIIVNYKNEVLLSDEFELDQKMTKFPGGGLEFGEGTIECIEREAREEFGQEIEVLEHFYTTDFFQKAMFRKGYQVINIYYKARFKDEINFKISDKPFDFEELTNGNQSFRWQEISELNPDDILFPIDKKVATMLMDEYKERYL